MGRLMAGFNRLHLRIMLPFVALVLAVGVISLLLRRHTLVRLMGRRPKKGHRVWPVTAAKRVWDRRVSTV